MTKVELLILRGPKGGRSVIEEGHEDYLCAAKRCVEGSEETVRD